MKPCESRQKLEFVEEAFLAFCRWPPLQVADAAAIDQKITLIGGRKWALDMFENDSHGVRFKTILFSNGAKFNINEDFNKQYVICSDATQVHIG